jgi:hypothetical protein
MSIAPVTRGCSNAAPHGTAEHDQRRAADPGGGDLLIDARLDGQQLAQFAQSLGAALA